MSKFKGTPGPWEVDGVEIRASASHPMERICEMAPGFSTEDAKLIATAPQLLLALQDAEEILRGALGNLPSVRSRVDAYANLIAKALGERP